ncbi:MAG: transporter [Phycisphaeraceae bacterium]|nr:transporter [Phycisphaeraceae bacterium]
MFRQGFTAMLGAMLLAMPVWAGRPLETDDSDPVEQGHFEVEAGFAYERDGHDNHYEAPMGLTFGLLPRMEIGVGFGGVMEQRESDSRNVESFSDIELGGKLKLLDQDTAWFDQAVAASVNLPLADDEDDLGSGYVDYDVSWIAQRTLGEKTALLFNLGYTWVGEDDADEDTDVLHYGPAVTYDLTDKLQPVAELLFETPVEGGKTAAGFNVGVRYMLTDAVTLDAAIGGHVAGDWPDLLVTTGLTWGF